MHSTADRKEAIRKYKEQKIPAGVFAVRCLATSQVWVGSALNLNAAENRTWFSLRMGAHLDKSLQSVWNAQGGQTFQYEILETLKDDLLPMAIADLLKEKKAQWIGQLGARPVY